MAYGGIWGYGKMFFMGVILKNRGEIFLYGVRYVLGEVIIDQRTFEQNRLLCGSFPIHGVYCERS